MKTLLQYIEKNWGKPQYCAHCESKSPLAVCGACFEHVYCGTSCQRSHWVCQHRYQCIKGQTKRPGEEEKEEEEDNPTITKKSHVVEYQDERQVISLNDLSKDIWQKLSSFLRGEDLKNLSVVNKIIQQRIREQYFKRLRWDITDDLLVDPRFLEIVKFVKAVVIHDQRGLDRVIELGAPLTDVRFIWTLNQPITLPQSLTHLSMKDKFKQPVTFPQGLLYLCYHHSYPFKDRIPQNIPKIDMYY